MFGFLSSTTKDLIYAIGESNESEAQRLAQKIEDINSSYKGYTPLYTAASLPQISFVTLLIDHGADVNHPIKDGSTPLYVAAALGRKENTKKLISAGADLLLSERNDGDHPLTAAASQGHRSIIEILIDAGVDVDHPRRKDTTALMCACSAEKQGNLGTVELLLNAGANPSLRNADGSTAMYGAIIRKNYPVIQLLVNAGVDPNQPTYKDYSAFDLVKEFEDKLAEKMLQPAPK